MRLVDWPSAALAQYRRKVHLPPLVTYQNLQLQELVAAFNRLGLDDAGDAELDFREVVDGYLVRGGRGLSLRLSFHFLL